MSATTEAAPQIDGACEHGRTAITCWMCDSAAASSRFNAATRRALRIGALVASTPERSQP